MKKFLAMAVAVVMVGALAFGGELRWLPVESQGRYGATHYVELEAGATFAGLATNVAYTQKFGIPAGTTVQFVGMECQVPFVGAVTTNTVLGDATVAFGTEGSATALMAAKQCSTNGTIWWFSGVPAVTATPTLTLARMTLTNVVNDVTNSYSVVTGATVTVSAAATADTLYAAATNLMVTVTPAVDQSLAWGTQGRVRLFLNKREKAGM